MELLHVNPWNSAQHVVNNQRNYVSRHHPIYYSEPGRHRSRGTESIATVKWVLEHQQ